MSLHNDIILGDNLQILAKMKARLVEPYEVDLVYLDPPFNSDQEFNFLLDKSGVYENAYSDTWKYDEVAIRTYQEIIEQKASFPIGKFIRAQHETLLETDPSMLAYLIAMSPRIELLHAILKDTGSIFLHCDSTASHYLKLLMDMVFGRNNFRSEIIWKRTASNNNARRPGQIVDSILFYSKTGLYTWNPVYHKYKEEYKSLFCMDDEGRLWKSESMTGCGSRNGDSGKEWKGINPGTYWPTPRHWAGNKTTEEEYYRRTGKELKGTIQERFDALDEIGLILWNTNKKTGKKAPSYKMYVDQRQGIPLQCLWTDISFGTRGEGEEDFSFSSDFSSGFPTQKPVALLERIISCASNSGDWVLDPYTGSGTTAIAARNLERNFVGFEISDRVQHFAKTRISRLFGNIDRISHMDDCPTDIESAKRIAKEDPSGKKIERWVIEQLGGTYAGVNNRGYDGNIKLKGFEDHKIRDIIVEVKSGQSSTLLPELERFDRTRKEKNKGVDGKNDDETGNAIIGVFVCFEESCSQNMRVLEFQSGFYEMPLGKEKKRFKRIQIIFIENFFDRSKKHGGLEIPGIIDTPDYSQTQDGIARRLQFEARQQKRYQEKILDAMLSGEFGDES